MSKKRLEVISSLIKKDEKILDVGTDHGLVPIFLLKNKITDKITASDINEGPLDSARKNLNKNNFLDKVELILTDGFNNLNPNDYDVIILAGMGGQTICKIIKSKKFNGRFIIHTTTSLGMVRKCISDNKMIIINEIIIKDNKIFNIIMETSVGNQKLSEKELFLGPILLKQKAKETNEYYNYLFKTFENNAKKSNDPNLYKKERDWLKEILWN